MSDGRPRFVSVHAVYMPPLGKPADGSPYAYRYSPRQLSGVDVNGHVWGLYDDTETVVGGRTALRWIRFVAEVAEP